MRNNYSKIRKLLVLMMVATGAVVNAYAETYPAPDYQGPASLPAFPSGFSAFEPPLDINAAAANAPLISEWTRSADQGETVAVAGSGSPTHYVIYTVGYTNQINTASWFGTQGAVTLPGNLPANEMYLMWPRSSNGIGKPVAINQTESWWMTASAGAGDTISIYGRNLGHNCKVWVQEKNAWLDAVACNPYKADFVIPASYGNATYTLWAHNGSGGKYGFARPLKLTVRSMPQWDENSNNWFNVKDYGAKGDGVSDDWTGKIEAAIKAADAKDWSTVYFPPGDYRIGSKLRLTGYNHIRIVGAGKDLVTIQPFSTYGSSAWPNYIIQNALVDCEIKGVTLKANSYGGQQIVRLESGTSNLLFDDVRLDQLDATISYTTGTMSSDKIVYMGGVDNVRFINCQFIEKVNLLATGDSSHIFFDQCDFVGGYDANTLFSIMDANGISIVNSTARNLDDTASDSSTTAWCLGRWIHGNGGIRDLYFNGNATINMTPRTGYSDANVGEQLMFEFARSNFRSEVTSSSANTVTCSLAPSSTLVGQVLVVQNGRGQGQNRVVTGVSGNTITVDHDWNIQLDASSVVLVGKYSKHIAIYKNTFDGRPRAVGSSFVGNAGIETYGGCVDLVADGNTFHQLRFPINVQSKDTAGDQGQINQPNFFNLFENNVGTDCYNAIAMYVDKTVGVTYFTPQLLGNVYRKNTFDSLSSSPLLYHGDFTSAVTGEEINMQVFDQNTLTNYTGAMTSYENIDTSGVVDQVTVEASVSPPPPDGPPAPVLTGVTISGPASVDEEASAQYSCTASWSDGTTTTVTPTWSENSSYATINANGLLSAGNVTSDQSVTITASYSGYTATQSVAIKYVAPTLSSITISGAASLDEETTAQYSCTASWSDGTTTTVTPTWSENSSYATINANGLLSAGNVISDQSVTVTASYSGKTATQSVTIKYVAPTLSSISVSGAASLNEGTTAQYSCTASWSDGTTTTVAPTWSENSSFATINASGLFSAADVTADQSVTVTASYGGKTATQSVTIKYVAPTLSSISISGAASLNEGTTAQYSCTANWSDGTATTVIPTWSENSTYATISSSGLITASDVTADQSITITASYSGKTATKSVTIKYVAPTLNSITVAGASSLDEQTTTQYSCTASWSDGTTTTITPTWSENSTYATISAIGLLAAADVTTNQSVTVTAVYSGKSATKSVTINYVAPTLSNISISGPASVDELTTAQYDCTANWSDGTSTIIKPSWDVNSLYATIDEDGLLLAADVTTDQSITITASYSGKTTSQVVSILYVAPPVTVTGISITGPSVLNENSNATYACTAEYSDGTSATVNPVWSVDAAYVSISSDGELSSGNVTADSPVTVSASFDGNKATYAVTVQMVTSQVIYPLSGFEGKTVWARLWDETAQEWHDLGEMVNPSELLIENVNPNQWYWISIKEYDETQGVWVSVHSAWISM